MEKGEGEQNFDRAEKVIKVKLVTVLATSLNKSHHLCTFHIHGVP